MNPRPIVLLVDDLAANRDTLRAVLGEETYRFIEAPDGEQALALAAASAPDLVLLDVVMPGIDGYDVCRRLRADPRLAEVPVIMVTALDDRASRIAGIEAGADDFVSKPYDRVELGARVRTITRLNRHRRLAEQRSQFQWVVEHAPDGYLLVSAQDEIHFANARARLWLGLPSDWQAAERETFLGVATRSFLRQPAESWRGWPEISSAPPMFPRLLVRPETPQAHAYILEVTVHENTGGRLVRLCDVAGRIAAQRDRRSFQVMMQHKLRTPLNSIIGPLELLAAGGADTDPVEQANWVTLAHDGAERLNLAVEDVLRFSEASRGGVPGGTFPVAGLAALVTSVAAGLNQPAVAVQVADEARSRSFPGSRETLEWVLFELLENSRKFHPRRAPAIEVRVRVERDQALTLAVRDDGVAISPEQLAHVGRPFFQGDKFFTGQTPGMGLGLASVCALAWQTGGACRVKNREDGPGVTVELQWPPAERVAGAATITLPQTDFARRLL